VSTGSNPRPPGFARSGKDTLSPLFVFSNLTSVTLKFHNSDDIDDNVMETLSKAWPRLQYLSLYLSVYTYPWKEPAVTLMGFIPLARYCSELEKLNIDIDARVDDYLLEDSKQRAGVRNTSLHSLEVRQSPINCSLPVIGFLWDIFPNISHLHYDSDDYVPLKYEEDWEEVCEGLRQRQLQQ
jgi:hypothetical protein